MQFQILKHLFEGIPPKGDKDAMEIDSDEQETQQLHHETASDEQAQKTLSTLKKFIDDPKGILQGK